MNEITIQGINLQGQVIADKFLTKDKTMTRRLMKTFADMYHLANVTLL